MKSVIIDTNGYIRLFLNDIPEQVDLVEKIIRQAKKEQITIHVPAIILFEIHFTLQKFYKLEKQDIIEKLKSLIGASYLHIESQNIFNKTLSIYEKETISFVDSFLLAKAILEKAELFTFDHKLKKLSV